MKNRSLLNITTALLILIGLFGGLNYGQIIAEPTANSSFSLIKHTYVGPSDYIEGSFRSPAFWTNLSPGLGGLIRYEYNISPLLSTEFGVQLSYHSNWQHPEGLSKYASSWVIQNDNFLALALRTPFKRNSLWERMRLSISVGAGLGTNRGVFAPSFKQYPSRYEVEFDEKRLIGNWAFFSLQAGAKVQYRISRKLGVNFAFDASRMITPPNSFVLIRNNLRLNPSLGIVCYYRESTDIHLHE